MFHLTSLVPCHGCGKCKPMIPLCKEDEDSRSCRRFRRTIPLFIRNIRRSHTDFISCSSKGHAGDGGRGAPLMSMTF